MYVFPCLLCTGIRSYSLLYQCSATTSYSFDHVLLESGARPSGGVIARPWRQTNPGEVLFCDTRTNTIGIHVHCACQHSNYRSPHTVPHLSPKPRSGRFAPTYRQKESTPRALSHTHTYIYIQKDIPQQSQHHNTQWPPPPLPPRVSTPRSPSAPSRTPSVSSMSTAPSRLRDEYAPPSLRFKKTTC